MSGITAHTTIADLLAVARADLAQGRLDAAMAGFVAVLRAEADNADAWSGRAGVFFQIGRDEDALTCLDRALAREPGNPVLLRERGDILLALNRADAALESYDRAIAIDYWTVGAMYGAGLCLLRLGRAEAALARFDVVAQRGPDWPPGLYQRGLALSRLHRWEDAVAAYDRAVAHAPDHADAFLERGNAQQALGRNADAVASYSQSLAIRPDHAVALNNRGVSLWRLERAAEAEQDFQRAIDLDPNLAPALANTGMVREEHGAALAAHALYRRALAVDPNEMVARLGVVSSTLPPVRAAGDDLDGIRAAHHAAVDELFAWAADPRTGAAVAGAVAPFNLAYHARDNRAEIAHYGAHCVAAMARWRDHIGLEVPPPLPRDPGGRRLRLGIVSSQFWTHSVWLAIVRGWVRHIDPARFDIHLFHTGTRQDNQTAWARENVSAFTIGLGEVEPWARAITAWQPDVLIYPDIGMEPMPMRLASLRLAKVQAVSWGHPETTGLSTIDYYISATGLEPPGAAAYYAEKLIQLPRLGCCYSALPITPQAPDMEKLGLRDDVPLLLCPGTPFKYAPEHDAVLARIARRIGPCQIVFFAYLRSPALSKLLMARLARAFAAEGVNFDDHVKLVPWHLTPWFYGLMQRADVFLDTIGFSGFNTAIQAIECGLPVVTVEGKFMRGRLASGILRTMELDELVAADTDAYVDIAVRLASDTAYRQSMRDRIVHQRHLLFDDVETVRAFEKFLEAAVA